MKLTSSLLRILMVGVSGLLLSTPSTGASWTQASGAGQIILTPSLSLSNQSWDQNQRVQAVPEFRKSEVFTLIEHGLTHNVTLMLAPALRSWEGAGQQTGTGLGTVDVGVRVRLLTGENDVLSVQTLVRLPDRELVTNFSQAGTQVREHELRLLYGTGFRLFNTYGFFNVEGAYRMRAGDPPDEFRFDSTLGWRPWPTTLTLFQSFMTSSHGPGLRGLPAYRFHNLQASVVQDLGKRVSLQVGARATVQGINALRERSLVGGLWFRY